MLDAHPFCFALALTTVFSIAGGSALQASSMVYQPNNGAIFSDANPNGNALMLATAVRPKDTKSESSSSAGIFGQDPATTLQQTILSQVSANINNQIFNCGTNCKAADSILVNGNSVLDYSTDANGNLILSYNSPNLGRTTINLGAVNRAGSR